MASFTALVPLNLHWYGNALVGPAGTTHRIPDAMYDEFHAEVEPNIKGGLTWRSLIDDSNPAVVSLSALTATAARFKGEPWFDIKAYGAIGDGATDNIVAIQAAIDAAAAAGGGAVYAPPGTYISSPLTLKSNVHLVGAGYEATILKLKNGVNGSFLVGQNFGTLTGTNSLAGIAQWSIENLTIDGNRANNSGGHGIQVYGYGYTLRDVRVRAVANDGIYSEWSNSAGSPTPQYDGMEAHVENIRVHDCGSNGITWKGPHDSNWAGVIVYGVSGNGVHLQPNGQIRAVNCHVYSVGLIPWYVEAESHFVNCIGEGAGGSAGNAQVVIRANNCLWIGGLISAPDVGKVGLEFANSASVCVIRDVMILNATTAVVVGAGCVQLDITGRVWSGTPPTLVSGIPSVDTVVDLHTDSNRGPGTVTPAIPASLAAVRNTTGVDVTIHIEGGTCTGTFIDGVRLNSHASPYTVRLPAYHEVSIQYSVAPTWKWIGG